MPPSTRHRPSQTPAPRRVTRRTVASRTRPLPEGPDPDAVLEPDAPAPETETEEGNAPEPASPPRAARRRAPRPRTLRGRPWSVPIALAALAVVLGGLAVSFALGARHLRGDTSAANTALTDNATTSTVNGQVASAVNTLFSYDYNDLDRTQRAADGLLVGKAVCQYNALFQVVRQQAPQQHLVVSVTVTSSGVEALTGNRARVLVFATQSSTSAVTKATSTAGAMFAVDAVRQGGRWRIENIDTFAGDQASSTCP